MLQIKLNHSGGAAMNMSADPYVIVYARAHTCAHVQTKSFFQPDIYREADSLFSGTRIGALRF